MSNIERILVVDDEITFRSMVARILEDSGYQYYLAANTREALDILEKKTIDLCLLDVVMPDMSGDEFLEKIKVSFPDISIIMSTGYGNLEMATKCRELGAEDYILKPFDPERLLISVQNALHRKRLLQENNFYKMRLENKLQENTKKLETSQSMLVQQEKLAAIGQLAAGVAHEINNPLGFISGNLNSLRKFLAKVIRYKEQVDKAKKSLPDESLELLKKAEKEFKIAYIFEDLDDLINDSIEGTERIKKIIQSLKSFSRTDSDTPSTIDINTCFEDAITVVWNEIKYNSELKRNFSDIPHIKGYPQQLSQVFMNLLVNASHAIKDKGVITITTSATDDQVEISIADTGCGISPENLNKIFDPFFTTKSTGKGTGLGMSIASDIIQKHHGYIDVKSELNVGTEFIIKIPIQPPG